MQYTKISSGETERQYSRSREVGGEEGQGGQRANSNTGADGSRKEEQRHCEMYESFLGEQLETEKKNHEE